MLGSILKGVEVIKTGLVWRIGDGKDVDMWRDPWIHREGPRQPITPRGQNILMEVSEIWDNHLVIATFCEEDATAILLIPLREEM
jgi:hypothetical protein